MLEFVTAPGASPLAMSMKLPEDVDQCEICPEAGVIISCISQNIAEHGGCSLIVDYGVERSDRFSLRVRNDNLLSLRINPSFFGENICCCKHFSQRRISVFKNLK